MSFLQSVSKKIMRSKKILAVFFLIILSGVVFFLVQPMRQQARIGLAGQTGTGLSLKDGLGTVNFSDADSVAGFIYKRSGTALSKSIKNKLASLESQVQQGKRQKLGALRFSKILTQTLLKDIDACSDQDLDYIGKNMRTTPYWDTTSSKVTMLRETGGVIIPPAEFYSYAKAFRDQSTAEARAWRNSSEDRIRQEVEDRLNYYSQGLSSWSNAPASGITPSQAVLLAYSIVSDDPMVGSDTDLRQSMLNVHNALTEINESDSEFTQMQTNSEVALEVQPPYGTTGYLFCSPLNYFFDDNTLLYLLQEIEKATA